MTTQLWMTIGYWLFMITGFLSLPAAMMSPMMFDSPESSSNMATNFLFYAVLTYPVMAGISIFLANMAARNFGEMAGLFVRWLPLLNIIIIILAIAYIEKYQGGSFSG